MITKVMYTWDIIKSMERSMAIAADMAEREKRKPRETKYQTTRFYNFRKQKKEKAQKERRNNL